MSLCRAPITISKLNTGGYIPTDMRSAIQSMAVEFSVMYTELPGGTF